MRLLILSCSFLFLALEGCDLTEAKRMDITRQKVRGLAPEVQGIEFFGRQDVSIDSLLTFAPTVSPEKVWTLLVGDSGVPKFNGWVVRGWWGDSLVFTASWVPGSGNWDSVPHIGTWSQHPGELRVEIDLLNNYLNPNPILDAFRGTWHSDTLSPKSSFHPHFLQDFNELHWDSTFDKTSPKVGDTLRLKIRVERGAPGRSDSMPVFSTYTGLRTLGDYVHYLKPTDTATLSWVVTSPAGDSLNLDLGWGVLGESHTFGFRVSR